MAGFDDNGVIMGEWIPCTPPSQRTLFTASLVEEESSRKPVLERELSLNHGQIGPEDADKKKKDDSSQTGFRLSEEKPNSRGGLGERIAARAGFNAPRLNTENIRAADVRSPCLTIASPGLSPATLLESPVFLSNPLVQPSPTTGKFSFLPVGNSKALPSGGPSDKTKDEFLDDIGSSFTFQPAVSHHSFPNIEISVEYEESRRSQTIEGTKPGFHEIESVDFQTGFHGTSAERPSHGNEADDPQDEEERRNGGDLVADGAAGEDGYNWRKYGQKQVKGSEYRRSYYKCTHPNCQVKKKIERSIEGHITEIIYKGAHNHLESSNMSLLDIQIDDGTEQTEQLSGMGTQKPGNTENEHDASSSFSNDEDEEEDGGTHGSASLGYADEGDEPELKRRKLEAYSMEISGATRAIREPRVVVQTTSDVDILDDGYRWRKYGQKVVKGNPNPRSYYKCTAPGCTVRKHVERASHDLQSIITTYEGKHNHDVPAARNSSQGGTGGSSGRSGSLQLAHTREHQSEPSNRFNRPPFGWPFTFQPQLGPAPGFSFGMNQPGLAGLTMQGLSFGQGKLPVSPLHPYLAQQPLVSQSDGLTFLSSEPKGEPMSESGPGPSSSLSTYQQIMSRLPQI